MINLIFPSLLCFTFLSLSPPRNWRRYLCCSVMRLIPQGIRGNRHGTGGKAGRVGSGNVRFRPNPFPCRSNSVRLVHSISQLHNGDLWFRNPSASPPKRLPDADAATAAISVPPTHRTGARPGFSAAPTSSRRPTVASSSTLVAPPPR